MNSLERAMRMFRILGALRDELFYYINTEDLATVYKIEELVEFLQQETREFVREAKEEWENEEIEEKVMEYGTTNSF